MAVTAIDGYHYTTLLQRTGATQELDLAVTMTPLGAVSRLEHALDGVDEAQERYRYRLHEAERRSCLLSLARRRHVRVRGRPFRQAPTGSGGR